MSLAFRIKRSGSVVAFLLLPICGLVLVVSGASGWAKAPAPGGDATATAAVGRQKAVGHRDAIAKKPTVKGSANHCSQLQKSAARRKCKKHANNTKTAAKATPLTGAAIAELRAQIAQTKEFDQRMTLRRGLIYRCYREGLAYEAQADLELLLKDVAAQSGPEQAHETAYSETMALVTRRWYPAAIRAFELMDNQYREGPHIEEIHYQIGLCELEMKHYTVAAGDLEMVAGTAKSVRLQGKALRKLAFVQLLKRDYDASLATLEKLEVVGKGTDVAEYARMRRGYVLALAHRVDDAIKAYEGFLEAFPHSRYGRVALRQLQGLKKVSVAAAK